MMAIVILFVASAGKMVSTQTLISQTTPWVYISKFTASPGTASWEVRVKLVQLRSKSSGTLKLNSVIYSENSFQDALIQTNCNAKEDSSGNLLVINVPLDGNWSVPVQGKFKQKYLSLWYFTVSSCNLNASYKIRVELNMINSDGSEFSAEEKGQEYIYILLLIAYSLLLLPNIQRIRESYEKTDNLSLNLLIFSISISAELLAIICKLLHLWNYSYNGSGLLVFDAAYNLLEVFSALLTIILLIVISDGWTLTYKAFPDSYVYIPVAFIVIILNLIITAVGRLTQDSYYRNSEYEGIPGLLIILFRLGLWIWFILLIRKLSSTQNSKIKSLLLKFSAAGSLYFWSLPIVVLASYIFHRHQRPQLILLLLNSLQICFYYFLTHIFGNSSDFYKLSTLSEGVLPGKAR